MVRDTLPRRGFLRGLASVPLLGGAVPAAIGTPAPANMDALWLSFLQAKGRQQAAGRAWRAAYDAVPWWAKDGPSYLYPDGTIKGAFCSAPAIPDHKLPDPGTSFLIRPTAASIERLHDLRPGMAPVEDLAAWRDRELVELRKREDAARAEHERVNEPALNAAEDARAEEMFAIEDAILALEPTSPTIIAMQVMLQAMAASEDDSTAEYGSAMGIAALALRGLLPMLTGEIAADAAELIADPTRPLSALRIWRGIEAVQA